jgi:hypothetical protein
MIPCDIRGATHVELLSGRIERITDKWGVGPDGELAPPSKGGFGVVTETGSRVSMFEARRYFSNAAVETMEHFKTGDRVRVTFGGRTARGVVELASKNGRSLMLFCEDAMLGGYVERIPVLWTGVTFTDLIRSEAVEIERVTP